MMNIKPGPGFARIWSSYLSTSKTLYITMSKGEKSYYTNYIIGAIVKCKFGALTQTPEKINKNYVLATKY